jgi:membrane-associated phospholipid phosphatase
MEAVAYEIGGGLYEASYNVIGESNPIAAMPSIHTAVTVLLVFPAWYSGRRWFIAALVYSVLMGITLVYTGEHYVVDVAMGAAVAAYGWATAGFWLRALAPLLRSRIALEAQGYPETGQPRTAE